ncbi:O-antigen ligase family protein [Eggerthella sinensis]|uniref:O-antigen ligase family protein n=1 Tax=Eggerthella sinensis TaxID=242230 RepID=UPI00266C879E|nr:O-antigen ligase family protein [Eggerthella sinensis]
MQRVSRTRDLLSYRAELITGQKSWLRVVMFLFGLSLSTNVVYAFTVGNTCVYIGYVFAFALCGYLVVSGRKRASAKLDLIDGSIWAFAAVACLSVSLSIIYSVSGQLPSETPLVALRGLVVLFCGLVVYYVVARLSEYAKYLVMGLALGVIVNGFVSALQMVAFESGSYFTLYYLFPQDSFSISADWGIWGTLPDGAGRITSFRSQGLFLETSHLMVFLVCIAPIAFVVLRSTVARVVILIATIFCCITSLSPNVLFVLVECALLLLVSPKKSGFIERKVRRGWIFVSLATMFALICMVALRSDFVISGIESVTNAIADLNFLTSTDEGTMGRWESMLSALSACLQYPLGTGWNTESLVLSHVYGSSEVASHSYVIRLLLEMGIVGIIAYIALVLRHSIPLLSRNSNIEELAIGLSVVFLFVCQATNGMTFVPWAWALLGLSSVAIRAAEKRRQNGK